MSASFLPDWLIQQTGDQRTCRMPWISFFVIQNLLLNVSIVSFQISEMSGDLRFKMNINHMFTRGNIWVMEGTCSCYMLNILSLGLDHMTHSSLIRLICLSLFFEEGSTRLDQPWQKWPTHPWGSRQSHWWSEAEMPGQDRLKQKRSVPSLHPQSKVWSFGHLEDGELGASFPWHPGDGVS